MLYLVGVQFARNTLFNFTGIFMSALNKFQGLCVEALRRVNVSPSPSPSACRRSFSGGARLRPPVKASAPCFAVAATQRQGGTSFP
jgi:hypothetical protein